MLQAYHRIPALNRATPNQCKFTNGSSRFRSVTGPLPTAASARGRVPQSQPITSDQQQLNRCKGLAAAVGRAQTVAAEYWDVIEFVPQDEKSMTRLGLVQEATADSFQVAPLVEQDQDVWVIDADAREVLVPAGNIIQVVEHVYSQRQDTQHNPHGEHAHDVWQVLCPLSSEVFKGHNRKKKAQP